MPTLIFRGSDLDPRLRKLLSTYNEAARGFDEKCTIFVTYLLPDSSPEASRFPDTETGSVRK